MERDRDQALVQLGTAVEAAVRRARRHRMQRRALLLGGVAATVGLVVRARDGWDPGGGPDPRRAADGHPADEAASAGGADGAGADRAGGSTGVDGAGGGAGAAGAGTPAGPAGRRAAGSAAPGATPQPPPPGIVADPASHLVLVDHERRLPPGWAPDDLVVPAVPFTFAGPHEKRHLRRAAAAALERLVAAAAADGVAVRAASGYRSEQTQADLWGLAVRRSGEEVAARTNARPGHSEHQTGLAIDVADDSGACVIEDCFADSPTAAWLARHAHRFGYLVRYPAGAEAVTGYRYEPWHLRYVGDVAAEITSRGLTLDRYLGAR